MDTRVIGKTNDLSGRTTVCVENHCKNSCKNYLRACAALRGKPRNRGEHVSGLERNCERPLAVQFFTVCNREASRVSVDLKGKGLSLALVQESRKQSGHTQSWFVPASGGLRVRR